MISRFSVAEILAQLLRGASKTQGIDKVIKDVFLEESDGSVSLRIGKQLFIINVREIS